MKIPFFSSWLEKRTRLKDFEKWMDHIIDGSPAQSGVRVDEKTAVQVVAVFSCIRLLSETIGSLPLPVYERLPKGKKKARDHPLYELLHDLPNPEMTAMDFKVCMMVNCLLYGDAYAEKVFNRAGDLIELWPIASPRVTAQYDGGELVYKIKMPNGKDKVWPKEKIFRITWITTNGITGYKPLEIAREAIGAAIAANTYAAKFFSNGTIAAGIAEYPGKLSDAARERYKKDFANRHAGLGNAFRLIFMEEGLKFTKLTTPPNEAQMLETRKFHVEEVARFFNVPPHMIMDMARATFNNIEHQSINFAEYSIRPWAVRWEQSIYKDLLDKQGRKKYFAELLLDGLVRGDIEARYKAYATGRQWGWLSANDVREKENQNPLPGKQGDIYMIPMNMIPADMAEDPKRSMPEKRSAAQRAKIVNANKRLFRDVSQRIVNREVADIRNNAKKLLTRDKTDFLNWLEEFYSNAGDWMKRMFLPVALSHAEMIEEAAAAEIDADLTSDIRDKMTDDVESYVDAFTARHTGSSKGQLIKIIEDDDDIDERLAEWEEKRADKMAERESVQLSGFISRAVFAALGVRRLVWRNTGSRTCPFCEQLHGKVVGIDQPFIMAGDAIEADDGSGMRVYGPKMHAPIHSHCQCQVEAEG